MSSPIALLTDDFTNSVIDPCWTTAVVGSATVAETGGQAVLTLPSSTAGSHSAYYRSSGLYDLTGDGFVWNIGTMVATGVAATALCELLTSDQTQELYWRQLSNAITARTIIAGVDTQRYTATWSSSTYKYLRIRESAGTIFWDSSTNGTSWTNRASLANPFGVTDLYVRFTVSCGNVASPGSFKLDDVNLILPAPSSTWRETTADWSISNRLRPVTLAATANAQGVLVTADTMDETTRALGGVLHYFAGPLGAASGGYLALTEYASLALAEASAFPIPVDGRVDLPILVDARYMRLYHRSTDASAHTIREFVPRRIVQAEDIEAESISAINIAAGAITADKIDVLNLGAIVADIGQLSIDATGWIYQGTGTGDAPTTGLKIFNSGGIGKLSTYNSGTEQVTLDTDGALKAGAGQTYLDATGANIVVNAAFSTRDAYKFVNSAGGSVLANWAVYNPAGGPYSLLQLNSVASKGSSMELRSTGSAGFNSFVQLNAQSSGSNATQFTVNADSTGSGSYIASLAGQSAARTELRIGGKLNVGSGVTGVGDGQLETSGNVAFGLGIQSNMRAYINGVDTSSSNYALYVDNSIGTKILACRNDVAIGFLGATPVTRPAVTGSRAANAALASLCTALANLGLITNSTTA